MLILQQMTAFLIFIILGYYIRKKGILDEKGSSGIAWIVANVANPALIISGAVNAQESLSARQVLTILGLGTAVYGGLIVLSFLLPCLLKRKGAERQAYRNIFLFSNGKCYIIFIHMRHPPSFICAFIYCISDQFFCNMYC